MYYIYLLQNPRGDVYKGQTRNIVRRIKEHNSNRCPGTRGKGPWKLVYSEEYSTREEAREREKFLKSGIGREWIHNNVDLGA